MQVSQDAHHVFANCPNEILMEIFSYLPVKLILRLRCVCKSWKELIQSENFISFHWKKTSNSSNRTDSLLVVSSNIIDQKPRFSLVNADSFSKKASQIELPMTAYFCGNRRTLSVCGSHNGLVCISSAALLNVYPIYIWNPSIRKIRTLPRGQIAKQGHFRCLNFLAFCFHKQADDYRVVRIVRFEKGSKCFYQVEIYSLNSNSWRRIPAVLPIPSAFVCRFLPKSLCLNGSAYWIIKDQSRGILNSILCFDFAIEEFHVIMLPDCLVHIDTPSPLCPGLVKDSLALLHCRPDGNKQQCDMWVRKTGSWVRLNTIVLPLLGIITRFWSLMELDYGFLIMKVVRGIYKSTLVLFDSELGKIKDVGSNLRSDWVSADSYFESLLLLDEV